MTELWRKSNHSNIYNSCVEVGWRKSARCLYNDDCVEVGNYRKSQKSRPPNWDCVEVGNAGPIVAVRDTANRGGTVLEFSGASWGKFLSSIK